MKTFLLILLSVSTITGYSQSPVSIGVSTGMNIAGLPSYHNGSSNIYQEKLFVSPVSGINARFELTNKITICTDLFYQHVGTNNYSMHESTYINRFENEEWVHSTFDNICFSIAAGFNFMIGRMKFNSFAGYEFDYGIHASYTRANLYYDIPDSYSAEAETTESEFATDPFDPEYDPFNIGSGKMRMNHLAFAGIGIEILQDIEMKLRISSGNYYCYSTDPHTFESDCMIITEYYRKMNYSLLLDFYLGKKNAATD